MAQREFAWCNLSNGPFSFSFSLGVSTVTVKKTLTFDAQWFQKMRHVNAHITPVLVSRFSGKRDLQNGAIQTFFFFPVESPTKTFRDKFHLACV